MIVVHKGRGCCGDDDYGGGDGDHGDHDGGRRGRQGRTE